MKRPSFVQPDRCIRRIIKVSVMVNMKLMLMGLTAVTLSAGVSGCASSNVTKTVQGAPITYKVGDGPAKYASLSTSIPHSSLGDRASVSYIPAIPAPSRPSGAPRAAAWRPVPQPQPQQSITPRFDPASVDQDL